MLIVLATLIITMTATTILVRAASTLQLRRQIQECRTMADDLLVAAETPIQRWLKEESAKAVAPADANSPRFEVINESLSFNGPECNLRITAFDQCGMVFLDSARGGSPLRLTILVDVLRVVDGIHRPKADAKSIPGLDWFAHSSKGSLTVQVFPVAKTTDMPAIGELIATHNGNTGAQLINVNTAPMPLVEAAMRLADRGGHEQVMAARKDGKPTNFGSSKAIGDAMSSSGNSSGGDSKFIPQIVISSNCWSFRIDVQVGPLWRSWWAIYQHGQVSGGGGWECVQRLAITE